MRSVHQVKSQSRSSDRASQSRIGQTSKQSKYHLQRSNYKQVQSDCFHTGKQHRPDICPAKTGNVFYANAKVIHLNSAGSSRVSSISKMRNTQSQKEYMMSNVQA